ncbi:Radical S-adenosyl methionine domain-containing protein 1, mitochondrial [Manis javanica]|nr:Radical S-adenosyl methionine domain-containing protein 1, mitochondrial [Manis javanica]
MRPGTLQLGSLPPLSLYVHLPWCIRKCPYCDFNCTSMAATAPELPEDRYIDALAADLESALPPIWGRTVHSIFIGGGTPSLFAPESIDRLLAAIRARLRMEADCEITYMEANPAPSRPTASRLPRGRCHAAVHWRASLTTACCRPWAAGMTAPRRACGRARGGRQLRDLQHRPMARRRQAELTCGPGCAKAFAPPRSPVGPATTIEPKAWFPPFPARPRDAWLGDMLGSHHCAHRCRGHAALRDLGLCA